MVDLLPEIEVVEDDAFNSSPLEPQLMGPQALQSFTAGQALQAKRAKTPLVCLTIQLPGLLTVKNLLCLVEACHSY